MKAKRRTLKRDPLDTVQVLMQPIEAWALIELSKSIKGSLQPHTVLVQREDGHLPALIGAVHTMAKELQKLKFPELA